MNAGGCDCFPEYTGAYCRTGEFRSCPLRYLHQLLSFFIIDLNPCAHLSPCEKRGTCSNGDPNQCSCAYLFGYTGMNCEEDIDECKMFPCANQATCIVSDHNACTQRI